MIDLGAALLVNTALLMTLHGLQVVARATEHGVNYALSNLDANKSESKFQKRTSRVARNQLEFVAALSALMTLAQFQSAELTEADLYSSMIIGARAAYIVITLLGLPFLRSASWLAGFTALVLFALDIVSA